jgi:hypothetical protein
VILHRESCIQHQQKGYGSVIVAQDTVIARAKLWYLYAVDCNLVIGGRPKSEPLDKKRCQKGGGKNK